MIDPKALSIPRVNAPSRREKAPQHKHGEHFLRGPIPLDWLCAASRAAGSGSGFKVAIALWYLSGLNRQAKTVKLSGTILRKMGIERHAAYRGLRALESAHLVRVERHPGRSPIVTILDIGETV